MDRTQSEILVLTVIGIFLVLLFGSPIKRKVRVLEENDKIEREGEQVSEATHPHAGLKLVSRTNVG